MNMSPHIRFQLVTFVSLMFSDKDRIILTSLIENVIFVSVSTISVKILLSFFIIYCDKSGNPIFCIPPFLFFCHPLSALGRASHHDPILDVSSFVMWRFIEVLPLRK